MEQPNRLQQIKECYQDSFFSTQVSSHSPLNQQSSMIPNNCFRISSKLKDEPRVYFKKMKEKKSQAEQKFNQLLHNNVKAKSQLHKLQKDAAVYRNQFIRLYYNKKFKLVQKDILNQHKQDNEYSFRLSKDHFHRQKMYNELSVSLRKQRKQREQELLRQTKRYNDKSFRQTIRNNQEKLRKMIFQSHDKVSQHKMDLADSKKKLKDLSLTKSKFNYMNKINEEMRLILQYKDQLQQSQKLFNPEQSLQTDLPVKCPRIN